MAPTIQTKSIEERERSKRSGEKKSDLVVRVKYCNTLPDIPFDPKFITYPFESNRFVQYNPTSLERNYKHDLLTEHDLGVNIDLIDPDTYKIDHTVLLDTADEKLLEEEVATPQDSKRSIQHRKNVSWMRKTEYISTEYNRFTPQAGAEAKIGAGSARKRFKEDDIYKDRESQLQAIESSFQQAKEPIEKHYSKPGVIPVEILPFFPDFDMWIHPCAQVIFDSDPAPQGKSTSVQTEEMSQALIRGMMDDEGNQFVAYFLPTEETVGKRKRDAEDGVEYDDDDIYDYTIARSYNWTVKNKASRGYEENYFCVFRNDAVYYNELETKVCLSKRRLKDGSFQHQKSRLLVQHRPLMEGERNLQMARLKALEPPGEEDEEMDVDQEAENKENDSEDEGDVKSDRGNAEMQSHADNEIVETQSNGEDKNVDNDEGSQHSDTKFRSRSVSRSPTPQSRERSKSRSRSRSPSGSEKEVGSPAESAKEDSEKEDKKSDAENESESEEENPEKEIFGSVSGSDSD